LLNLLRACFGGVGNERKILAASSGGFSGAEIEQAIVAGLYRAFIAKQQLTTEILITEGVLIEKRGSQIMREQKVHFGHAGVL